MSVEALTDRPTNDPGVDGIMKAWSTTAPASERGRSKPKPTIRERGDAIVRITTSTICGTDLHILRATFPA